MLGVPSPISQQEIRPGMVAAIYQSCSGPTFYGPKVVYTPQSQAFKGTIISASGNSFQVRVNEQTFVPRPYSDSREQITYVSIVPGEVIEVNVRDLSQLSSNTTRWFWLVKDHQIMNPSEDINGKKVYRFPSDLSAVHIGDSGEFFMFGLSKTPGGYKYGDALVINISTSDQSSSAAPTITTPPANQTVSTGQPATFSVTASGTAPLAYQWQKNGVTISGATSAAYTTPATTTADSGSTYRVIVSNAAGSVTSTAALLTVNAAGSVPGDLNGDGQRTLTDVLWLIEMLVGLRAKDLATADLTGDGQLTLADVKALIRLLVGLP